MCNTQEEECLERNIGWGDRSSAEREGPGNTHVSYTRIELSVYGQGVDCV